MTSFRFTASTTPPSPDLYHLGVVREEVNETPVYLRSTSRELVAHFGGMPVPSDAIAPLVYDEIHRVLNDVLGPVWWQRMREMTGIEERAYRHDRFVRNLLPSKILIGIREIAIMSHLTGDPVIVGAGLMAWSAIDQRLDENREDLVQRMRSTVESIQATRSIFIDFLR